jgi:hypothetical protein
MENRKYIIFNVSECDKINFNEVNETSVETLRKSIDGTLAFVKYDSDEMPLSVSTLTTKSEPYTQTEIITILNTPEWVIELNP